MKKKMVKAMSLGALLFLTFVHSAYAKSYDLDDHHTQIEGALIESFGENYKSFLDMNVYKTTLAEKVEHILYNGNETYPAYYGGMYIDESNNLVIQMVKNKGSHNVLLSNQIPIIKKIKELDNTIKMEYVEHSYSDLESINNQIIQYFLKNGVNVDGFVGNYIDVYTNKVVVELKNNTIEEQNEFKQYVIDSDILSFIKEKNTHSTASYNAGAKYNANETITSSGGITININICTIGYRAKLNGVSGFVTAGHCFGKIGDSATIGSVTKRNFSQTMDAAFVATNSGVSITNNLEITNYLAQYLNTSSGGYLAPGTTVGKVGAMSGYQTGTVQSLNYSSTWDDGSYHTNMIKASNYNIDGDSGGPVFKLGTSSFPYGTVVGVTSSGYLDGGNLTGFYLADDIATSLGITRY